MASIPLLCNICPKLPEFSDISHLLTHVGSKGHLSHYFKAQVRSRQEPAVRQQLDTYDQWYAKYQIEKLLSQRMVLKESKEVKAGLKTAKRAAPAPSGTFIPSKRPTRAASRSQQLSDRTEVGAIDPQLSRDPLLSAQLQTRPTPTSRDPLSGLLASRHRAYIPQMRQMGSLSRSRAHSLDPCPADSLPPRTGKKANDTNDGGDPQETREHSPLEMTYPDPSTLSEASHVRAFPPSPARTVNNLQNLASESEADKYTPPAEEAGPAQSPVLKGVQWPGMNIFDSASPEAQRKRNQKKTNSILVQMELNSSAVEPLERIFWPEGDLKKERIITGMVESSPVKEESPRPKRRRQVPCRTVLGDLSTNSSNRGRRPFATKSSSRRTESRDADLGDLSKRAPAMLDLPSSGENPAMKMSRSGIINDEDIEWRLNAGNPIERGDDFIIYHDEAESESDHLLRVNDSITNAMEYPPVPGFDTSRNGTLDFVNQDFTYAASPSESFLSARGDRHLSTNTLTQFEYHATEGHQSWMPMNNKENLEPLLGHRVHDEVRESRSERSTQRYFYVNNAQSPEFFDFLPPQLDFGGFGFANSGFFGTSRNPLIPHGQGQHGPNSLADEEGAMYQHG